MSKEEITQFLQDMQVEEPASKEEFHQAVKAAYKDRATQVYFIWKKLKELYPEVINDLLCGKYRIKGRRALRN